MNAVQEYYGFSTYDSLAGLLAVSEIETVVNLTNIGAHFEVSQRLDDTAEAHAARFYAAFCNILSDTVRTTFKAVEDGTIGKPLQVYADLDDTPIHLMEFEKVKKPTGTP